MCRDNDRQKWTSNLHLNTGSVNLHIDQMLQCSESVYSAVSLTLHHWEIFYIQTERKPSTRRMMIINICIWTLVISVQGSFALLITQNVIYMHVLDGKPDFVLDTLITGAIIISWNIIHRNYRTSFCDSDSLDRSCSTRRNSYYKLSN